MIITVTLNPCVDKTVEVEKFSINRMNRISASRTDYAGKGINLSFTLSQLGHGSVATGFLGEQTSAGYEVVFKKYGVVNDFVYIPGAVRVNTKIIDKSTSEQTDINESGLSVTKEMKAELLDKIKDYSKDGNIIIFSGSFPAGFCREDFSQFLKAVVNGGAKVAADCDGGYLREAVNAGVFLIKPNIYEFEELAGESLPDIESIKNRALKEAQNGIGYAIVSLDKRGAIFASAGEVFHLPAPKIKRLGSTCAAGDSLVAGFLAGLLAKKSFLESAKLAMAASAAAVSMDGTEPPPPELINKILNGYL